MEVNFASLTFFRLTALAYLNFANRPLLKGKVLQLLRDIEANVMSSWTHLWRNTYPYSQGF